MKIDDFYVDVHEKIKVDVVLRIRNKSGKIGTVLNGAIFLSKGEKNSCSIKNYHSLEGQKFLGFLKVERIHHLIKKSFVL